MNEKIKSLISGLIDNINGMTSVEKLGLPLSADNIKIEHQDGKVFVISPEQTVSYFFTHNNYILNLDLLKRVMHVYGVELENEEPKSIRTFKKQIVEKIKEEK